MKTPAGKECKFFYGDYYRGRQHEECRLLKDHGLSWTPEGQGFLAAHRETFQDAVSDLAGLLDQGPA